MRVTSQLICGRGLPRLARRLSPRSASVAQTVLKQAAAPSHSWQLPLGGVWRCYSQQARRSEDEIKAIQAFDLPPDTLSAHDLKTYVSAMKGAVEAEQKYQEMQGALLQAAQEAEERKDIRQAAATYSQVVDRSIGNDHLHTAAKAAQLWGKVGEVDLQKTYREVAGRRKRQVFNSTLRLAYTLLDRGLLAEAYEQFGQVLRVNPYHRGARDALGKIEGLFEEQEMQTLETYAPDLARLRDRIFDAQRTFYPRDESIAGAQPSLGVRT